jgi:hypothetical protein
MKKLPWLRLDAFDIVVDPFPTLEPFTEKVDITVYWLGKAVDLISLEETRIYVCESAVVLSHICVCARQYLSNFLSISSIFCF